jgi:hypothetical protein
MAKRFPNILSDLELAGYKFRGHGVCSGCRKQIEYWSPPGSASRAYDLMASSTAPVKMHRCHSHREPTPESLRRSAVQW